MLTIPLGRIAAPDEVSHLVTFLAGRVAGAKPVLVLVDPEGDLTVEHDDALLVAGVGVRAGTAASPVAPSAVLIEPIPLRPRRPGRCGRVRTRPLVGTTEEVVDRLRELDVVAHDHRDAYRPFNERFNRPHDGHAAARVVDDFFAEFTN